jgi:hypothetical protein
MKDNYKLKQPLFFTDSIRFQFRKNWEEQIFSQIGECATQKTETSAAEIFELGHGHPHPKYMKYYLEYS